MQEWSVMFVKMDEKSLGMIKVEYFYSLRLVLVHSTTFPYETLHSYRLGCDYVDDSCRD